LRCTIALLTDTSHDVMAGICFIQWLGKTVLARLVTEIDDVNVMLVRTGSDDVQIGGQSVRLSSVAELFDICE